MQTPGIIQCGNAGDGCFGFFEVYFNRWGCGVAESGSCSEEIYIKKYSWLCTSSPDNILNCDVVIGSLMTYFILACQ